MDDFLQASGWSLPDTTTLIRTASRLISAAALAALVGWEREKHGRAAGLRTHMMVALGAALFTLIPLHAGAGASDLAQIVKGIAAGVGFLGAGAILKLAPEKDILGLTTAASIWLTAAIGLAAGAGQLWTALIATILALVILFLLFRLEVAAAAKPNQPQK